MLPIYCAICASLNITIELFIFGLSLGCQAKVSLCAGGSHSKVRRAGEEDWESSGGIETLLGGPAGGTAGESKKIKTRTRYHLPKANFSHTTSVFSWHATISSELCFLLSLSGDCCAIILSSAISWMAQ